jgi:hypothetical protein
MSKFWDKVLDNRSIFHFIIFKNLYIELYWGSTCSDNIGLVFKALDFQLAHAGLIQILSISFWLLHLGIGISYDR